jgi:hypothetical protein
MNLTRIFLKTYRSLTDKLFDIISSYDIYCELIGEEIEVGKVILSPIRNDKRPTFILFIPDDKDEIFFKDFAWRGGNVFTFVRLFAIYQEGVTLNTREDIIKYLDKKLGLGLFSNTARNKHITRRKLNKEFYSSKRSIKFKSRDFTKRDIEYWSNYHISKETLKLFNVRSVHKLLNEADEVIYTYSRYQLAFAYVIFNKVKLYNPEADPKFKWRNTCPAYYFQGLQQINELKTNNKKLILTKSMKDVMVFYEFLHEHYDVLAPHSETYIPTDEFMASLYRKYDVIIIIYDFDAAGVMYANKLRKRNTDKLKVKFVSTKRIIINGKIKVIDKDISDFAEYRDKEEVIKKLKDMNLWVE